MRYLVSYDLHNYKDYTRLIATLRSMGAIKIHQSLWGVDSSLSHRDLVQKLAVTVDGDDSVMVMTAPPPDGWASVRLQQSAVSYLSGIPQSLYWTKPLGVPSAFR